MGVYHIGTVNANFESRCRQEPFDELPACHYNYERINRTGKLCAKSERSLNMKPKEHFHGSDLEEIEQVYGIKKEEIVSFSANVNREFDS